MTVVAVVGVEIGEVLAGVGDLLGWAVVALTTIAVVTVRVGVCPGRLVAYSQLLMPWTAALSTVVVVVAALTDRPALAIGAAVAVVGAAATIAPKVRRSRHGPSVDGPTVRIVLANLYLDNPEAEEAFAQLLDRRPDVIVMTELTDELVARFDQLAGGRYAARVHRVPLRGEYEAGIFVADGEALLESDVADDGTLRTVEATVRVGDRTLLVVAAHPTAPEDRSTFRTWKQQLRSLRGRLHRVDGAAVVLGDLNSGTLQAPYERLARSTRFRDAHAEQGLALTPSWGVLPALPRWVPTLVARLDHLLVTPEVEVRELTDLDPVGSDHRPFEADLAIGG